MSLAGQGGFRAVSRLKEGWGAAGDALFVGRLFGTCPLLCCCGRVRLGELTEAIQQCWCTVASCVAAEHLVTKIDWQCVTVRLAGGTRGSWCAPSNGCPDGRVFTHHLLCQALYFTRAGPTCLVCDASPLETGVCVYSFRCLTVCAEQIKLPGLSRVVSCRGGQSYQR